MGFSAGTGGNILPVRVREGKFMLSKYKLEKIDRQNCFEDGVSNILYFPITDSGDFPRGIRSKTENIIDGMINTYEVDNNCKLDLTRLHLNARMVVFMDKSGNWSKEISVVVSGASASDDIWIEGEYSIEDGDSLYKPFRAYFMRRLEEKLFMV